MVLIPFPSTEIMAGTKRGGINYALMKVFGNSRRLIILQAIFGAVLSFTSCVNELCITTDQTLEFQGKWAEYGKTRTALQSDGSSIWWSTQEEINVFYGSVSSGKFTSSNSFETETVRFSGTLPVHTGMADHLSQVFWAVYPYNSANTCDGSSVTLTVPDRQAGVEGTFADHFFPAVARGEGTDLAFYNVCGGACFSVTREGIQSIRFKSIGGESLAGKVRVCFSPEGKPVVKEVLEPKSEVVIYAPDGGFIPEKKYFAAFIPGKLSRGLSITFITMEQAGTLNLEKEITVNRSRFGKLDELDEGVDFADDPVIIDPEDLVTVHNPVKGGLEDVLTNWGDYETIRALKVTGTMNDIDFRFIRDLENLRYLDISRIDNTKLPDRAFYEVWSITHLVLPRHLSEIGAELCTRSSVEQVWLFRGIKRIGSSAFEGCQSLVSIEIPSGVRIIDDYAFSQCLSLTSITIPASVDSLRSAAFGGCSSLSSVIIEGNSQLKTIGSGAFWSCPLTSITIPSSVEKIDNTAFSSCESLSSVHFECGSQLKTIGSGAFETCPLTSITIPASVEIIDNTAFSSCESLSNVHFERGSQLKSIGRDAFSHCPLTSITIPAKVETLGTSAFGNCTSLVSVLFEDNSSLKTIEGDFKYSGLSMSGGAFWGCSSLKSITIPASVESIGPRTFANCTSLESVLFENNASLKIIDAPSENNSECGAFYACSSLKSIIIPSKVKRIGDYSFQDCTGLTSIIFEANSELAEIANNTFENCTSLTRISFKEGSKLTRIGSETSHYHSPFRNCSNLKTFDASGCSYLSSICDYAFYQLSNLRLFYCGAETPPSRGRGAFLDIDPYAILKVPDTSVDAYKKAGWEDAFLSITGFNE